MGGASQLSIQLSQFAQAPVLANQWYRGFPTPGFAMTGFTPILALVGQPRCAGLLDGSPPTLLERDDIYSHQIGFGLIVEAGVLAAAPIVQCEMSLLVNGDVHYTLIEQVQTVVSLANPNIYLAAGSWTSDLVNPVSVGARERLQLRAGFNSNEPATTDIVMAVAGQIKGDGSAVGYPSTISYRVIDLPPTRRL
jgi:hypothetical protein